MLDDMTASGEDTLANAASAPRVEEGWCSPLTPCEMTKIKAIGNKSAVTREVCRRGDGSFILVSHCGQSREVLMVGEPNA